jgi:hypothetical protein
MGRSITVLKPCDLQQAFLNNQSFAVAGETVEDIKKVFYIHSISKDNTTDICSITDVDGNVPLTSSVDAQYNNPIKFDGKFVVTCASAVRVIYSYIQAR